MAEQYGRGKLFMVDKKQRVKRKVSQDKLHPSKALLQ
jgi:hypothetical protein